MDGSADTTWRSRLLPEFGSPPSPPLAMGWRHLLFENWRIDPEAVRERIPDALTVDEYDGSAWLSVIPFTNVHVRPRGLPRRLGLPLPEINLRTYVTHDGEPGIYFFSLDAEGVTSVLGARLFHHLPYYYARISMRESDDGGIRFESQRWHPGDRPVAYEATYHPTDASFQATEDPKAAFLAERYRFYTQAPDGSLRYTDVDHEPWTLRPATADVETNTVLSANGFERPDADPVYYYGAGVDVTASTSRRRASGGR